VLLVLAKSVFAVAMTALANHVVRVFAMCAEEQMVWTYTRRIIAAVADEARIAFQNLPIGQFVGDAMGVMRAPTKPELAVSIGADIPTPQPAPIETLLDAGPKALVRIGALVVIAACLRAVLADLRHEVSHCLAAAGARSSDFFGANTSRLCVARVRTETTRLAWSAAELCSTGYARAKNFGGVVLSESGVAFRERHIRLLYHTRPQ